MATKIPFVPSNQAWAMQASAPQIDACCGLGKGVNLLDNWYLGTGVINQRNKALLSTDDTYAYFIDRWRMKNLSASLTSGGIVLAPNSDQTGRFGQITEGRKGLSNQMTTFSVILDGELFYINKKINTGNWSTTKGLGKGIFLGIAASSKGLEVEILLSKDSGEHTISACKFEVGGQQTLAVQDDEGNWVLADPLPNPSTELIKCQRYQFLGPLTGIYYQTVGSSYRAFIPISTTLRSTPTLVGTPIIYKVASNDTVGGVTLSGISVRNNGILVSLSGASEPVWPYFNTGVGFDANL